MFEPFGVINEEEELERRNQEIVALQSAKKRIIKIYRFSLPLMLATLSEYGATFVSSIILAQYSTKALAASGLIIPTQDWVITTIGTGMNGGSLLVSEKCGGGNFRDVGQVWQQSLLLGAILGSAAMPIFRYSDKAYRMINQPAELTPITQQYFRTFSHGVPAMLMQEGNHQLFAGTENPTPILITNLIQTIATGALGYTLTFGKFGAPNIGVAGLGAASSIVSWANLIGTTVYICCNSKYSQYSLLARFRNGNCNTFWIALKKGVPIALQSSAEFFTILASMGMVGWIGGDDLAAAGAVSRWVSIFAIPSIGLNMSTSILVSKAIGANEKQIANQLGVTNMWASQIAPSVGMLMFALCTKQLLNLFVDSTSENYGQILHASSSLFIINGVGQFIDSFRAVSLGALIGDKDITYPTMSNLFCMTVIGLGTSYLLAFPAELGSKGVFVGRYLAIGLAAFLNFKRWRNRRDFQPHTQPQRKNKVFGNFCGLFSRRRQSALLQSTATNPLIINP
jgi:multidrug resistance protein, MATE family